MNACWVPIPGFGEPLLFRVSSNRALRKIAAREHEQRDVWGWGSKAVCSVLALAGDCATHGRLTGGNCALQPSGRRFAMASPRPIPQKGARAIN